MLEAAPHSALPTAKMAKPTTTAKRRPNICVKVSTSLQQKCEQRTSAMPPVRGKKTVDARAYDDPIQTKDAPPSALMMVGSAVDTAAYTV
jgi:hypothetical protein